MPSGRVNKARRTNSGTNFKQVRFESLEDRRLLALVPELVADVNPEFQDSFTRSHTNFNGALYFSNSEEATGTELWRSDGTPEGTQLVKDIYPGEFNSNPSGLVAFKEQLYFFALPQVSPGGWELWKTDGSEAGTLPVKLIPYGANAFDGGPRDLTIVGDSFYFSIADATGGRELWTSDGTAAGTLRVKDVRVGANGSNPRSLVNANGTLFFIANDGQSGEELWKSDGTTAGTVRVKDIRPGSYGSLPEYSRQVLTSVGSLVYFGAHDGVHGIELWKSDGTEAGTVMVKEIRDGAFPGLSNAFTPQVAALDGAFFFAADDGVSGLELWRSDGTDGGTRMVKDISPGNTGGLNYGPTRFALFQGELYFAAISFQPLIELWKTDGTEAGTQLVKDIHTTGSSSPRSLTAANSILFFTAEDGVHGRELWRSDGTSEGTVLVRDITPGTNGGGPGYMVDLNGTLAFFADDGESGRELWMSDATESGTFRVKDLRPGTKECTPIWSVPRTSVVNDELFFTATSGQFRRELWKTNGQANRTVKIREFTSGTPAQLTSIGNMLYFTEINNSSAELWRSDGTEAGTFIVKDIYAEIYGSQPQSLTNVNGTLYFTAEDGVHGRELWKSDGTESGTVLVKDILPGDGDANPAALTKVGGMLYFLANDGTTGLELWKSDGTPAGTVLVKDIAAGPNGSGITWMTDVDGTLFFSANDGLTGKELWKSDGTEAGTMRVKDIRPLAVNSNPHALTNVQGTLYFAIGDDSGGNEFLWRSDGTESGTELVTSVPMVASTPEPYTLQHLNGTVFFVGFGNTSGYELWKTDGTPAGTSLVKDINPLGASSHPRVLRAINGTLFFLADDPEHGLELWRSDGTEVGTQLVGEIRSGERDSIRIRATYTFFDVVRVGNKLLLPADDGFHGIELWSYDIAPGDTNFDGQVNITDLNNVRNNFGATGNALGDTDGDGVVGISDLNAVRNNFGAGGPSPVSVGRGEVLDFDREVRVGVFVDGASAQFEKNIEDVLFSAQLNVISSAQSDRTGVQARRLKAVDRWFSML